MNYSTSWYYYNHNDSIAFNFLHLLHRESLLCDQLVVIIAAHGSYTEGKYYMLLDDYYSSTEILQELHPRHKTFIYAAGCQSGYFAENQKVYLDWNILSSVNHGSDSAFGYFDEDTEQLDKLISAEITWPAIQAFTAVMNSYTSIESIYAAHLQYLEQNYLNTDYFSWENAPVLWDGDEKNDLMI